MRRVGDGPVSCHRTNKSITNHISVAVNHQRSPRAQDPPTTSPGPLPHASTSFRLIFASQNTRQQTAGTRRSPGHAYFCLQSHDQREGGRHVCPSGSGQRTRRRPGRGERGLQKDRKSADTANEKKLETGICRGGWWAVLYWSCD